MVIIRNLFLFACVTVLFSFEKKPTDYTEILPGVTKVSDYLYYDQTEATNLWWLEYLSWTKKMYGADSAQYTSIYPDTLVWCDKLSYNEPYVKYYLKNEADKDYPLVGVTWKQASDFCSWRKERVKELLVAWGELDEAPMVFNYRLPTYEEWMLIYEDVSKQTFLIGEEGKRASGENMGVAGEVERQRGYHRSS